MDVKTDLVRFDKMRTFELDLILFEENTEI